MESYILKKAVKGDTDLFPQWKNRKEKDTFHTKGIDWESHQKYFNKQLQALNSESYIYYINKRAIGQIKLDYIGNCAQIHYSIEKEYQGQGHEERILLLVEKMVRKERKDLMFLTIEIKEENVAFQNKVRNLGYENYNEIKYTKDLTIRKKETIFDEKRELSRKQKGILVLTNNQNALPIYSWLCKKDYKVYLYSEEIYLEQLKHMKVELIICYNYKYIVKKEIIQAVQKNIINLHISFLPWNRGSNPNFWSFIENSPKGVTIHYVDERLDKGKILIQEEYFFDEENETFVSTYEKLNERIKKLLYENWDKIEKRQLIGKMAKETGSYHSQKDLLMVRHKMDFFWEENISEVKRRYEQIFGINNHQNC